jgi:serine/threonine-protein kinase RIO1
MGERRKTKILILFFLIMDKQNFVNFMTENGMSFENADKTYEQLEERFDGDWKKAADYLQDVVKYLQKHQ